MRTLPVRIALRASDQGTPARDFSAPSTGRLSSSSGTVHDRSADEFLTVGEPDFAFEGTESGAAFGCSAVDGVDFEGRGRDIERGSRHGEKAENERRGGRARAGSPPWIIRDVDTSRAGVRRYRLACSYYRV